MENQKIVITINNATKRWYELKGYDIPQHKVQLWCTTKSGQRVKNGIKHRVANGTQIKVLVSDLAPQSNIKIPVTCPLCGKLSMITLRSYKIKHSDNCNECVKKQTKGDGSHGYWVKKLITNNTKAQCDISGEKDKRFLVLHHLNSRSNGGRNIPENYVILSANYHLAFHISNGGMGNACTEYDYNTFKVLEVTR